ncbi:uncharacterized protein LOC111376762 [Olea europaea var. sylvestris]|uniref:uncharacterized protein LOC111376762 n=1 Tax=Olea europaea var. sylvestris TaxID=158386 RepID=UPI000C1CF5F6|nr:uncharacterized protein LOC111376762 [Olea europaea var. sylvestris]
MNYVKTWRSRERTLKLIREDPTESFQQLPSYFYMLEQTNSGTVTKLEVDGHNRFKYCFMALGASIEGWVHCRPVIVVDGTYQNGHYGGTLFTSCTQDANNSIFVLAFSVGDNENDASWTWFLENLKGAYGNREGHCLVLDRHNSIKTAVEQVYPGTSHGIYTYHFLQNLKSHFGKSGHNITPPFNLAVHTYTLSDFEYNKQQLDTINKKIRVTKVVKNYPIIALLDSLQQTIQSWFFKNKDTTYDTFTKLSTKYEKMMREMSTSLRNTRMTIIFVTLHHIHIYVTWWNIQYGSSFVVDIEKRTCTCRMLQVDQMPCPHALVVIATTKRDPYDYCSYFYTREAYINAYQNIVYPVRNPNEWIVAPKVEDVIVLAPNQKRSSGRPTEKRRRSCIKGKQTVKCGCCEGSGHNHRTCNNLLPLAKK